MKSGLPYKHRQLNTYKITTPNLSKSFHYVYKAEKLNSQKKTNEKNKHSSFYFFKQKKSNPWDLFMYQLEAAANEICHFIAPNHTSTSRVLFDSSKKDIALVSKNLPGFKPALDDPLKMEDLEIPALKELSIQYLEEYDTRARLEKLKIDNKPLDHILIYLFNKETKKQVPVTVKDLRNYRIVKGNGIGITTNYMFENDDCHTSNISKDGLMIDFDMWFWSFFYQFKEKGIIDWAIRDPQNRFGVSVRDLENLPILQDAHFFYFPTFSARMIPESIMSIASKFLNVSRNAFTSESNEIYKKLSTHEVFIYHKFMTLLTYCLTSKEQFHNLLTLHIKSQLNNKEKNVIDDLVNHIEERKNAILFNLYLSNQFKQFIKNYGDEALQKIVVKFANYNQKCLQKSEKNPIFKDHIIPLNTVINTYVNIAAKFKFSKSQVDLKKAKNIEHLIKENEQMLTSNSKQQSLRV